MFKSHLSKYKKALVIGTGGGNDITSSVLISMYLQKLGIQTDICGLLSPAAIHYYNNKFEASINLIGENVRRILPGKEKQEIPFIDAHLPEIAKKYNINIEKFYNLSLRFGTQKLLEDLNELIEEDNYDLVIGVDMGGDILGRIEIDNTLLSPLLDFSSLFILGNLKIDSFLIEFGLGTDGELKNSNIKDILNNLNNENIILDSTKISKSDSELLKFKELNSEISEIRRGHATFMTLKTLEHNSSNIDSIYKFKSRIGDKKWFTEFNVTLSQEYFGKVFLLDVKSLYGKRKTSAINYSNPLEQYIRLKKNLHWKTELDLFCIFSESNWSSAGTGSCLQLLCPSLLINTEDRQSIINHGLKYMVEGNADVSLISSEDFVHCKTNELDFIPAGRFHLIFPKSSNQEFTNLQESVLKYQSY